MGKLKSYLVAMRVLGIAVFLGMAYVGAAYSAAAKNPAVLSSPSVTKIILVVLENTSYSEAMNQPFLKKLANEGTLLSNYYALAHPSQPNYVAMIAGSTMGVSDDGNFDVNGTHFGDLLEAQGKSWHVYAEQFPGNCFTGKKKNTYVRKHNPFISFTNIQQNSQRCSNVTDASQFSDDFLSGKISDFSLYIPDMDNDGHDTGAAYADNAMSQLFTPLLNGKSNLKDYLLVMTFDEDDRFEGNHIYNVFFGPNILRGNKITARYNHFNLLRTFEDLLGTGTLGREDSKVSSIQGFLK